MSFGNSFITAHYSEHIQDERDTLKDKPLSHFTIDLSSITPPTSQNLFQDSGRLKMFNCDIVQTESTSVSAIQTEFFDTSGVPTGTEPKLFGIISFAQKVGGVNEGFTQHNYQFPERGLPFENGIGIICTPLFGSPTIVNVDAFFGYVKIIDDYPDL